MSPGPVSTTSPDPVLIVQFPDGSELPANQVLREILVENLGNVPLSSILDNNVLVLQQLQLEAAGLVTLGQEEAAELLSFAEEA